MHGKTKRTGRHPAALFMQLRRLHAWIGMLIAPTVLFMASTGVLQIYDLHEAHPGYTPPPLIEKLGVLHKKQTFQARRRGPPPEFLKRFAGRPGFGERRPAPPKPGLATELLKAFFAIAAGGLIVSTLLGIWMAMLPGQKRLLHAVLLLIGAAVPIGLIIIGA